MDLTAEETYNRIMNKTSALRVRKGFAGITLKSNFSEREGKIKTACSIQIKLAGRVIQLRDASYRKCLERLEQELSRL